MQGVIIRDGAEPGGSGGLEFDLPEILAALGERVAKSRWRCASLQYTSRDEQNIPVLEEAATSGQPRLRFSTDERHRAIAAGDRRRLRSS